MQRQSRRNGGVQRVDPAARGEPANGAARTPNTAAHAFMLIADHEDRRPRQVQLAHSLWCVRIEPHDKYTAFACRGERAHERGHPTQARVLDRTG